MVPARLDLEAEPERTFCPLEPGCQVPTGFLLVMPRSLNSREPSLVPTSRLCEVTSRTAKRASNAKCTSRECSATTEMQLPRRLGTHTPPLPAAGLSYRRRQSTC